MSRWYRAYEGTVNDGKLAEAAIIAGVSRALSVAAWHALLESAACKNNCGSYETSSRRVAAVFCEPVASIEALFEAFDEIGLTVDGAIASWKKRQFSSDDSKGRVAKHRAEKRQKTATPDDGNSDVTACNGGVTPPETETDTKKKELSSNDDSPSGDEPSLRPEHVFEFYQETARAIGLPIPRDFTPERRQLVRHRIAQYSLADFQEVFARCRGSPFLRGDKGRTPLTFDWLMKKANFQKVLEGNYDG